MKKTHILILGGGPTGLTLAHLLAQKKVPFLLVEKRKDVDPLPKTRGLSVRSMEIFASLGLDKLLLKEQPEEKMRHISWVDGFGKEPLVQQPLGQSIDPISPQTTNLITQCALERVLKENLSEENLLFFHELKNFEEKDDKVYGTIENIETGETEVIEADYMVACDGINSSVRAKLGIELMGQPVLGHTLNITFRAIPLQLQNPPYSAITLFSNLQLMGRYLHSINGFDEWVLGKQIPANSGESLEMYTPSYCLEFIHQTFGTKEIDVMIQDVDFWPIGAALAAPRFKDRIFLAGDAAQVLPPSGSLGLNCGISDAHNLAWKLAAAVDGWGSGELLASYDIERAKAVEYHLNCSAENAARFKPLFEAVQTENTKKITEAIKGLDLKSEQIKQDLGATYPHGCVVPVEEEPSEEWIPNASPGSRAPHLPIKKGSSLELFQKRFVLLIGKEGSTWEHAIKRWEGRIPYEVTKVEATEFNALYGVTDKGACLVRPDGYVAWRAKETPENPEVELDFLADLISNR